MRDDYFTLEELSGIVRLHRTCIHRIFAEYPDFPVTRIGNRYIISKLEFFRWFYEHRNDDMLQHRFDTKQIDAEREAYLNHRRNARIRRRFVL